MFLTFVDDVVVVAVTVVVVADPNSQGASEPSGFISDLYHLVIINNKQNKIITLTIFDQYNAT